MANVVRYISAVGIHERFDLDLEFQPGVNILHGKNGTGKTTLLHILANILNGDFERFAFLPFETIEVHLDDARKIKLRQYEHSEDNKIEIEIDGIEARHFSVKEVQEQLRYRPGATRPEPQIYLQSYRSLRSLVSTAYFPAFRTLIEASGNETYAFDPYLYSPPPATFPGLPGTLTERTTMTSTLFARRFFGDFVPWLNYPSPIDVSRRLSTEIQQALNIVATTDRQLLSEAFLNIFRTLSGESNPSQDQPERILENIKSLFSRLENSSIIADSSSGEEVYTKLRELVPSFRIRPEKEDVYVPILEVYKSSLEERAEVQEKSMKKLNTYLDSVNHFLEGKGLVFLKRSDREPTVPMIKFHETDLYSNIGALSSGERQIVTLIYSATHMSGQKVVLIDEPEISLHIDWQSMLIPEMVAQLQDRQIITCTHSPMIGEAYEDQMIQLEIKPTQKKGRLDIDTVDEIEETL